MSAPAPPDDDPTLANELLATGLLMGLLTRVEQDKVLLHAELQNEHAPRLFVRFPGALASSYELTLTVVPGSAEPVVGTDA